MSGYFPYTFQSGTTALLLATELGKADMVKVLTDAGADLEAKNKVTYPI